MPYCTQADILNLELSKEELIQLTDDDDLDEINTSMVDAAISKADAEIDAYCQDGYTVPFSPVPTIIIGWSATLAAFNLYRNRTKPATIIDRYNKVMSWLKDISTGKATLPGASANDNTSFPGSTTDGTVQVFRQTQKDASGNVVGDIGSMETW